MAQHPTGDADVTAAEDADARRFEHVSDQLKVAFQALGDPAVPAADRSDWHTRLIAITNSAKHDLATAETRLERYWSDWEARVGPRPS